MELAVNTFAKGLQNDTYPIVQGNDTLSDALNATFITMNGNEVVLLNDMGNRRVDNAYLPPGYEPVGIKEYGGIIYVASYNPITNKSQIGSFPSPERRIGEEDENLGNFINLDVNNQESIFTTFTENGLNYLKEESVLVPLTKDTSLHSGDKFTVYSSYLWEENSKKLLTNFDNINEGKIDSPKNRQYTLSLGILNSQNEFVDITNSLERWNEDEIIGFEDTDSELYKFNKGYFIASDFHKPDITESDAKLILERLKLAINTYSYKLVGPLYLKINFNYINSINYNITGSKTSDTSAEIIINAHIEYNCPDNGRYSNDSDDIYYSYYTNCNLNNKFVYLYKKNLNNYESEENIEYSIKNFPVYNPETNLYSVDIELVGNISATKDSKYEYLLGVPAIINNSNILVKGISREGTIDISLLGSDIVNLTEWRYTYNSTKEEGIVSYYIDNYPKIGHTFKKLLYKLIKSIGDDNCDLNGKIDENKTDYKNEEGWIDVPYTESGFSGGTITINSSTLEKEIYNVYLRYIDDNSITESSEYKYLDIAQWYLPTELFNDKYSEEINFNNIKDYTINSTIESDFIPEIGYPIYNNTTGTLMSDVRKDTYKLENRMTFTVSVKNQSSYKILKKEHLPSSVRISLNSNKLIISNPSNSTNSIESEIETSGTETVTDNDYNKYISINNDIILNEGGVSSINYTISLLLKSAGNNSPTEFNVEHMFMNFGKYLEMTDKSTWFKAPWIAVEGYNDDDEWADFDIKFSNEALIEDMREHNHREDMIGDIAVVTDSPIYAKNYKSKIVSALDKHAELSQLFIAGTSQDWWVPYIRCNTSLRRAYTCVWMRCRDSDIGNSWALLCLIPYSKGPVDDKYRTAIPWNDFISYINQLNYYSDFGLSGKKSVYTYNSNNYALVKLFIWIINLKLKYEIKLSLSQDLSRVNFSLSNNTILKDSVYSFELPSFKQSNNKNFITEVDKLTSEISQGTIDNYCEDAINATNLVAGCLYKKNGSDYSTATLLKVSEGKYPNFSNIPLFPITTTTKPPRPVEEEERGDWWKCLDWSGFPVILGIHEFTRTDTR